MKIVEGSVPYIALIPACKDGDACLAATLYERRSIRTLKPDPLDDRQIASLLWAAQGKNIYGTRTIPSAGALYPIDVFAVMESGVWLYDVSMHNLLWPREEPYVANDVRKPLAEACLGQKWIADAPLSLVITAAPDRTLEKYGDRGHRYVCMEAGNVSQNVSLMATSLGLGSVIVGAFQDDKVHSILRLPSGVFPLLIVSVGKYEC